MTGPNPSTPARGGLGLWARRILPYVLAAGIVWFLVDKVGVAEIAQAMRGVDLHLIVVATVFSCVANTVFGADKWRRVVNRMGARVSFVESLFIRLGAGPIRFAVPGKFGELIKPIYLQKHHGLPFVQGTSSLVLDKMFNFWGVMFFLFLGIPFFSHDVPQIAIALPVLSVVGPVALWRFRRALYRVAQRVHGKLHKFMTDLLSAFEVIPPQSQAFLMAYSVVFQATELITFFLVCRAVGIAPPVPFHDCMVFVPLVIIVSQIPTWSGIGVREFAVTALLLRSGYGSEAQALCAGLLLSMVEYIFPAAIGIPALPAFLKSLGSTKVSELDAGQGAAR